MTTPRGETGIEWPTLALIGLCYGGWAVALFWLSGVSAGAATVVLTLLIALQSSLTHEALHGHPFRHAWLNEALVSLPIGLFIPYGRFRDLHLAHHRDARLTDPYDDPESNYLDPAQWASLPRWQRHLREANNTLLGRIVIGPALGQVAFLRADWALWRAGDQSVLRAWALHLPGVALVLLLVAWSPLSLGAYLLAAYAGLGILKIRTYLEHRAHEKCRARSVIIEDRGPLAFLFLNNNLHLVHHMHPGVAWYQLPGLYRAGRARYLACNEGYVYRSYGQVFRAHFLRRKDPVAHPIWPLR